MLAKLFITLLLVTGLFIQAPQVQAEYSLPTFDSCHNPKGSVKADYPTGLHAIVGVMGVQTGSDKVFFLSEDDYTQCYCPTNGNTGIKTNWLSAGNISKEDQNVLTTQGWVYIPNGADWGLSNQPYLAKNTEFSCGGSGDNGGGGGSSSGGSGGQGGGGSVAGVSTLAATNSAYSKYQIIATFLLAASLILYGYKIQKSNA